jgi:protein-S-isoprenylcysteine O-methyltransferase Ste14
MPRRGITVYLWKKDPNLLERRVKAGPGAEKEKSQNRIQLFASAAFIGILIRPSLDHRFTWSDVPLSLVVAGEILTSLGFFIVFIAFRENTYTSSKAGMIFPRSSTRSES